MAFLVGIVTVLSILFTFRPTYAVVITATECTVAAVQAAHTAAGNGDTVRLPPCNVSIWSSTVTITKKIILEGSGIGSTIIHRSAVSASYPATNPMFLVNGVTGFEMRHMTLDGTYDSNPNQWSDMGLRILNSIDFNIHHMAFSNFGVALHIEHNPVVGKGLIHNSSFTNSRYVDLDGTGALGYGVSVNGNGTYPALSLGNEQNVFIEDSTFTNNRHAIASNNGSRYVFRYNTIVRTVNVSGSAIDAHGYSASWPQGSRQYEIYNNVINDSLVQAAGIAPRGGDGVIFDNQISPASGNKDVYLSQESSGPATESCSDPVSVSGGYPLEDQIRSLYISGNTRTGTATPAVIVVEGPCVTGNFIVLNRDYFTTPRPGYAAFMHPHPLQGVVTPDPVDGLLLRLAFEEGSGTSVADSTGINAVTSLTGGFSWQPGVIGGGSVEFTANGVGTLPNTTLGSPSTFSIAGYVQLTGVGGANGGTMINIGNYVIVRVYPDRIRVAYQSAAGVFTALEYFTTVGSGWNHITYTHTASARQLYLNGVLVSSATSTPLLWTGQGVNTTIANSAIGQAGFELYGRLDEVRVYNKVLTAADITALLSEGPSPPTITITSPTPAGTYSTNSNTINVSGSVTDNVAVASVTVTCPQCNPPLTDSPATITGSTWAKNGIVLGVAPSTNVITVKATDNEGSTAIANLTVTYTIIPPTGGPACTRWADQNATGNGLSVNTPYTIGAFLAAHSNTPGAVLCLKNNTYSGGGNLIHIPAGFAGTSTNPITIRALNDGEVLIDGGNGRPIDMQGVWGVIEGVNTHGGDNGNIVFRGNDWKVRRTIAWNNTSTQMGTENMIILAGRRNLIEDCAAFGLAAKLITAGAGGGGSHDSGNIIRRCWARWENRTGTESPTSTMEMGYHQNGVIWENVISTRDLVPGGNQAGDRDPPFTMFRTKNTKVLGSISYSTAAQNYNSTLHMVAYGDWGYQSESDPWATNNVLLKDIIAVTPKSTKTFELDQDPAAHPQLPVNNTVENLVGISLNTGITCQAGAWSGCSNIRTGTTVAAVLNSYPAPKPATIWDAVPGVCKRYVNGSLTATGLWPWPMNQRIKDALIKSGRASLDITATMETLLGTIPENCKSDEVIEPETPVATSLTFQSSPTTTTVCPAPANVATVLVKDQFGAPLAVTGLDVTLAIGNNPGSGVIAGSLTVDTVSGIATFNDWCINTAGVGYTLTATSPGLTGAESPAITITDDPEPHKLIFASGPLTIPAYDIITPALVVNVYNDQDLLVSDSTASITLSLDNAVDGEELIGTLTKNAVDGVATFNNLKVAGKPKPTYTIRAVSSGLLDAVYTISTTERVATDQAAGSLSSTPLPLRSKLR